jgi:hypothetical protein
MSSCPVTLQEWEQFRAEQAYLSLDQLTPYPERIFVTVGQQLQEIATQDFVNAIVQQQLDTLGDDAVTSVST